MTTLHLDTPGQPARGARRARAASQARSESAAHRAQALRHYEAQRYREALRAASAVLRERPRDALLWNLCGAAALALGLSADAEQFWKVAIASDPDCADAHYNLALWNYQQGNLDAAARGFARAITIAPHHAPALNNLGAVLQQSARFTEAVTLFKHSLALDPSNAEAWSNLGLALIELGRREEARVSLDRAIELKPDFATALTGRGRISMESGERAAAVKFLEAAIAADPAHGEAFYYLSQLAIPAGSAPWIELLEKAYERRRTLPDKVASAINFAMGKLQESWGEHETAFRAYAEGNRLRYARRPFDERADEQWFAALIECFPRNFHAQCPAADEPAAESGGRVPVFVVGMPRSGTTLVEQMLASHPDIFGAGELTTLAELAATLPPGVPAPAQRPEWLRRLRALGNTYLTQVWPTAVGSRFLVDKMPGNYCYLGLLPLMLPHAKIIHITRDPLDTCFSCFATPFAYGHEYAFDLATLGRRYLRYRRLMSHWNQVLMPGRMLEVRYEALVAAPEQQLRRMLAHVGVPWDARCLSFHQHSRTVTTASFAQVRRPLYYDSIGRWRRFEHDLKPLREVLASGLPDGTLADSLPRPGHAL